MNPTKQIGRYSLPLLSVVAIKQRSGWRAWLKKGYDVTLSINRVIHFTEEEKRQYDQAVEKHNKVRDLYGMCRTLGFRG
jgi:hypothetical protein